MKKKKNKALHWPIGIFLAIMAVVAMGAWTIGVANSNPVIMDDFYFDKYQDVELNYNEIQKSQMAFDKKYNISKNLDNFKLGDNELVLKIVTKDNQPVEDANITVKITRPISNKEDMNLNVISIKNGNYKLSPFEIKSEGRWQILSKVQVGELVSFSKIDINATK